jgi:hypothetical protein
MFRKFSWIDFSLVRFSQGYQSTIEELWRSPSGFVEIVSPNAAVQPICEAQRSNVVWNRGLGGSGLRLGDPAGGRTHFLPEHQVQLCGMFLDMAHVVQKQLREADFTPREPAAFLGLLVGECFNRRLAFLTTMI